MEGRIALVGGTGPEGVGLATRWALAGERVTIGSRSRERAEVAAGRVSALASASVDGAVNRDAVADADVVVITLPLTGLRESLTDLAPVLTGKLVVSVVAAIEFVDGRPRPVTIPQGSAAQFIQDLIPECKVTSGFHTLSAEKLADPSAELGEDAIIFGDDTEVRHRTMTLAEKIRGLRALSGGRLGNSIYAEHFVGMLATLNRIHKAHTGLRVVGLNKRAPATGPSSG